MNSKPILKKIDFSDKPTAAVNEDTAKQADAFLKMTEESQLQKQ